MKIQISAEQMNALGIKEKELDNMHRSNLEHNKKKTKKEKYKSNNSVKKESVIVDSDDFFINPYTFVPLSKGGKQINDEKEKRDKTGYIKCSIIPKTDIFIPNSSFDEALVDNSKLNLQADKKHKSYDFYSYENIENTDKNRSVPKEPVISGSEIRGVIRSAYEVFTDSCMSVLENKAFSARYIEPKKAGILKWLGDKWVIYPAKKYMLNVSYKNANNIEKYSTMYSIEYKGDKKYIKVSDKEYYHGDKVKFKVSGTGYIKTVNTRRGNRRIKLDLVEEIGKSFRNEGYICFGEPINKKHHESIFEIQKREKAIKVLESDIERYKNIIEKYYRDTVINKNMNEKDKHRGYKHIELESLKQKDRVIPVWYSKVGSNTYISPASIGREIYCNTEFSIARSYIPCSEDEDIKGDRVCNACKLFGTMGGEEAISTKIRFSDANIKGKPQYEKITPLKALMGPKISSFEFYTNIDEGVKLNSKRELWNADYYLNNNEKFVLFKHNQINLNGRKYYWHNRNVERSDYISDKKDEFNTTIRPLKKSDGNNNIFEFKVYFEDISELELKRLLFSLNFGSNDNELCHKIGKGKPLGLGSIKITVDEVMVRKLKVDNDKVIILNEERKEYSENKVYKSKPDFLLCSDETYDGMIKVCDFNAIKDCSKIKYPYTRNSKARKTEISGSAIEWFVKNRTEFGFRKPAYKQKLPYINGESQQLLSYEVK